MSAESTLRFDCFGSHCAVLVSGGGRLGSAELASQLARRQLREWHGRFSRFEPASELTLLNQDPRQRVPVTRTMARLAQAVVDSASSTGGLVDATLVWEIELAGYASELGPPLALDEALRLAPPRTAGSPSPFERWRQIEVDPAHCGVTRTPGVGIDSGGLAKGLFADLIGARLDSHGAYAIDCGGDLRLGGADGAVRPVEVTSPFGTGVLHTFELSRGGVATSGIGRHSWLDAHGAPAHHLLDPGSGRPAFTGIVQATALAPTALEAETLAKAALLSGPGDAAGWLPHGGLLVFEDGGHELVAA
ncbi:MAG: FAD:protein FMN transferase [Thermoleophilaceae bacterium]